MYSVVLLAGVILSASASGLNWLQSGEDQLTVDKKSEDFAAIGCSGLFDQANFARLERLCEECYQLYRLPDMFATCR